MDSSTSTNAVVIFNLNDDCLLDVFKYLDLRDLSNVANVCKRFNQNARECLKYSKKKNLHLMDDIKSDGDSVRQFMLKTSNILRHFGAYFTKFSEGDLGSKQHHWSEEARAMCRSKIFELVVEYCSGTLVELEFAGIDVEDEILATMKSLLKHLHKISLTEVGIGETFLNMLPSVSMELRELKLSLRPNRNTVEGQVLRFDCLHEPFRKLVTISLGNFEELTNSDIEEFLKRNKQLKEVELVGCRQIDRQTLRFIAMHVPTVEKLNLSNQLLEQEDVKYFGQLRHLESLELQFDFMLSLPHYEHLASAIRKIGAANNPLKYLSVSFLKVVGRSRSYPRAYDLRFEEAIQSLKNLKELHLSKAGGFMIPRITEHCPELRTMCVDLDYAPITNFITRVVNYGVRLEVLTITQYIDFTFFGTLFHEDVRIEHYEKWLNLVENRPNRTPLRIHLDNRAYTPCIPRSVRVREVNPPFSLSIGDEHFF